MKVSMKDLHNAVFFLLLVLTFYATRNIATRILMVLFVGITIVRFISEKMKLHVPYYVVGMALFILYGYINILTDNVIDKNVAQTMVVSLLLNLIMAVAILEYILMSDDILHIVSLTEKAVFVVVLFVSVISFRTLFSGRLGGGTELNSNSLGMLAVLGCTFNIYYLNQRTLKKPKHIFKIVFYTILVLLSGSRKSLIMLMEVIIIPYLFKDKRKFLKVLFLGIVGIVIAYFAVMKIPTFYNIIGVRIENLINFIKFTDASGDGSIITRSGMIEAGMDLFWKKPWTGYGYDCFKMAPTRYYGFYSHNNYVELLVSGGVIGLVLYYIPVVWLLIKLIKNRRVEPIITYLIGYYVAFMSIEYAYVSYYSRVDWYITSIILGVLFFSIVWQERKE